MAAWVPLPLKIFSKQRAKIYIFKDQLQNNLSRRRDLNPRPEVYKTPALPTELRRHLDGGNDQLADSLFPPYPSRSRWINQTLAREIFLREAPRPYGRDINLSTLRVERNPAEANPPSLKLQRDTRPYVFIPSLTAGTFCGGG